MNWASKSQAKGLEGTTETYGIQHTASRKAKGMVAHRVSRSAAAERGKAGRGEHGCGANTGIAASTNFKAKQGGTGWGEHVECGIQEGPFIRMLRHCSVHDYDV